MKLSSGSDGRAAGAGLEGFLAGRPQFPWRGLLGQRFDLFRCQCQVKV